VIEDLAITAPVRGDRPVEMTVRLSARADDGWDAVVDALTDRATRPVRCATARVRVTDDSAGPATVDLDDLGGGRPVVSRVESTGALFRFGPRFDCVTELRGASAEADVLIGRLDLADEFEADLDEYAVHPALLDRALALRLSVGGQVPFACRRIVAYGDLPGHVVARTTTRQADARRLVLDAVLYDRLGREVLVVEGFTKVAADHGRLAGAAASSGIGLTSGITVDEGVRTTLRLLTERTAATVAVVPAAEWPGETGIADPRPAPGETDIADARPAPGAAEPAPKPEPGDPRDPGAAGVGLIAQVWAETLGVPEVGAADDFFELGGDSLTAVQLISRLRDRFGRSMNLADLFENPTPERFAAAVAAEGR